MWWNVGPHLQRRQKLEAGFAFGVPGFARPVDREGNKRALTHRSTTFFDTETDIEELRHLLKAKYGTLCRAWRVGLDVDGSGGLDFGEFTKALQHIGFSGNIRTLWFNLDDDHSGSVSLKEIDAQAYHMLEKFRVMCGRHHGGVMNTWHNLLDADKSGTVSYEEFRQALPELGFTCEEEQYEIFNYLITTPGICYLTVHDIEFLQTWEEEKLARAFRKRLPSGWVNQDPYGWNPSQATSMMSKSTYPKMMSTNPSMSTLGFGGYAPQSEVQEEVVDYGDEIVYDENKVKADFREFLVDKYGDLCTAFDAMDANGSGSLSLVEFQAVVSTVLRYCRPSDANRLFLCMNDDPDGVMTWDELGILRHEWVKHVLDRRQKRIQKNAERSGGVAGQKLKLGETPRQMRSYGTHKERLKNVDKRKDVAFGMPLPRGWGFPPHFTPHKLPPLPLSAR